MVHRTRIDLRRPDPRAPDNAALMAIAHWPPLFVSGGGGAAARRGGPRGTGHTHTFQKIKLGNNHQIHKKSIYKVPSTRTVARSAARSTLGWCCLRLCSIKPAVGATQPFARFDDDDVTQPFSSRADQTPPPVDHVLLPAQPFHSPSPPCSRRALAQQAHLAHAVHRAHDQRARAARSCTRRRPGSARSDGTSPWIARASTARVRHCCPPHPRSASTIGHARRKNRLSKAWLTARAGLGGGLLPTVSRTPHGL